MTKNPTEEAYRRGFLHGAHVVDEFIRGRPDLNPLILSAHVCNVAAMFRNEWTTYQVDIPDYSGFVKAEIVEAICKNHEIFAKFVSK